MMTTFHVLLSICRFLAYLINVAVLHIYDPSVTHMYNGYREHIYLYMACGKIQPKTFWPLGQLTIVGGY
jgi:hypothetical protein